MTDADFFSDPAETKFLGLDFSSAPSARKPVVVAWGRRTLLAAQSGLDESCAVQAELLGLKNFSNLPALQAWLQAPTRWVGGFDLPFGLPRELVEALNWPLDWPALMSHYAALSRQEIRQLFADFCASRPVGGKFAHRACDLPAGSSPSMKWVNPPVAFMLHAGVPLLRAAGVSFPGLCPGDPQRVALEAYPGLLARQVLGRRSYKADDKARQTPERRQARQDLLTALKQGRHSLAVRLLLSPLLREQLLDDAKGDALDAALCLIQAVWAAGQPRWGWPEVVDPLEGWILGA